jgi:hypothetical protein
MILFVSWLLKTWDASLDGKGDNMVSMIIAPIHARRQYPESGIGQLFLACDTRRENSRYEKTTCPV